MGWIYLAVALYTFRNCLGFFAWSQAKAYGQSKPDADDYGMGTFVGLFAGIAWPIYWVYRLAHYVHFKWIDGSDFSYVFWVPKPREIESAADKRKRKEREREDNIREYQRHVNEEERANGLTLTKWNF